MTLLFVSIAGKTAKMTDFLILGFMVLSVRAPSSCNKTPMASKRYIPFAIQHVDIPCKDLTRISTFYERVFSWTTTPTGFPFYRLWKTPGEGTLEGGFYVLEGDLPSKGIGLHITVEEIDPILEKVKQNGGTVVKEKFIIAEEIGWNAFFKDTEGNELGLYAQSEARRQAA